MGIKRDWAILSSWHTQLVETELRITSLLTGSSAWISSPCYTALWISHYPFTSKNLSYIKVHYEYLITWKMRTIDIHYNPMCSKTRGEKCGIILTMASTRWQNYGGFYPLYTCVHPESSAPINIYYFIRSKANIKVLLFVALWLSSI